MLPNGTPETLYLLSTKTLSIRSSKALSRNVESGVKSKNDINNVKTKLSQP